MIDTGSAEALRTGIEQQANLGVERVHLNVSTEGGEVASATALYGALLATPVELVTVNTHLVTSSGIVLFLSGDRRLAHHEATFLFHRIAVYTPAGWPTRVERLDVGDLERCA